MGYISGNMRDHIDAILEIVAQLHGAGEEVRGHELVCVLLGSMPESYESLVIALKGRDEADPNPDYVAGKPIGEYQRHFESNETQTDENNTTLFLRIDKWFSSTKQQCSIW